MYCRQCGTQVPEDSAFCHQCGARVYLGETKREGTGAQAAERRAMVGRRCKNSAAQGCNS